MIKVNNVKQNPGTLWTIKLHCFTLLNWLNPVSGSLLSTSVHLLCPAVSKSSDCSGFILPPGHTHTHTSQASLYNDVCVWRSAGSQCVSLCILKFLLFHQLTQHQNLSGNNIASFSQLHLSFVLPRCRWGPGTPLVLSPHSVSAPAMLTGVCTMATTRRPDRLASSVNESTLNRNIAAILLSFHFLLIILLAHSIQEWPDKSAAQWATWWRGSSGVWMPLASMMFQRAVALFSAVLASCRSCCWYSKPPSISSERRLISWGKACVFAGAFYALFLMPQMERYSILCVWVFVCKSDRATGPLFQRKINFAGASLQRVFVPLNCVKQRAIIWIEQSVAWR